MRNPDDAVIVSTARTAIGTAGRGSLVDADPIDLAALVVAEALRRSGIDMAAVDDVVLGECLQGGGVIARHAAIDAGLVQVPGLAENRQCASGLAAVQVAAASIRSAMDQVVVAGGVHSTSLFPLARRRVPGTDEWHDWMSPTHPPVEGAPNDDMSITVGWNAACLADVSREEMDAWALRSHQRAVAVIDAGSFVDEIVAVEVTDRDGQRRRFDIDEHPRRDTTMERLATLKPLHPEIEGFSITAGNAAGLNDGAAALVMTSRRFAAAHDLPVLATVGAWASVGVPPAETGLAPVAAVRKVLARASLDPSQVTLWEINEAFASVSVAVTKQLELDDATVNVLGSGCSLGHPIGMTGARMVISLIHELTRRGGGRGVATMCAGGGMASALVLDVG